MIAAITGALGVTLIDLTAAAVDDLRGAETVTTLAPAPVSSGFALYAVAA